MKKILIYSVMMILFAGFTGCNDWLDINQDPNNLTSSTKELVLTGAEKQFAERQQIGSSGGYNALYGAWIGYYGHSGGWSGWNNVKSYNMTSSDYNADFNDPYRAELKSLQYVKAAAMEEGNFAYMAIADILSSVTYQRLVDTYGDIPYSEAVGGFDGNVTPVYDDAQEVYNDLVMKLDSAIIYLNLAAENSQTVDETSDIIGGGDLEYWKQIANTFKLRILMRQSLARDSYVSSNMSFDEVGFITSSVTANPGYIDNTSGKMNPIYTAYGKNTSGDLTSANQQYGLNVFLSALYKSSNDPRLELCWEPGVESENYDHALQLGQNGAPEDHWGHSSVRMGPGIYGGTTNGDVMVISIMETDFLIAEALARGYNLSSAGVTGTAQEYWEAGVVASIEYYGERKGVETDDLITTYLENLVGDAAWNDGDPIRSIIYQKYIAMVGINHYEAYADFRRTGYPEPGDPNEIETSMISYYNNIIRAQVPVRMLYPQRELDINSENVNAAIDKTGVTYNSEFIMDAKIFWDVN
ncbi:SusD/RagB family nutrient-binding outer membrane lipoprotein [Maribellus mangrovi]|uniref:SusD/RagB family nutrient-binding outer membrane lipoprotein n=1 Tax=Maribellus mangrovi TaxID=3133146 RepID=UPI0030ED6E30